MKLFYRKYGSGPPLVILHGLYGSSDNWVTIAKSLGDSFTVYLPDHRNHGLSPHNKIHDYSSMRDDLHELMADLKIGKFFLVGHSMGGKAAISFAMKWPEMILGLLIADISPFVNEDSKKQFYNQHLTILNAILSVDLSKISTRGEAERILKEKISSENEIGFILKNLQRNSDATFSWKLNTPALLDNLDKIMEGMDRNNITLDQITGFPVIFLQGGESDYIPSTDLKDIQKIFPGAELIKIENAGHWIHADQPEEVMKNIKKLVG